MRHRPIQKRAQQRVQQILDATASLVAENGIEAFRVNNVADRAGVPIGSIYQYFNNKEEILRSLIERYFLDMESYFSDHMNVIKDITDFITKLEQTLRYCLSLVDSDAAFRQLFLGAHAWEIMRNADWEDTLLNARVLTDKLSDLLPHIDEHDVFAFCVIICDSSGSTARISIRCPEMAEQLFDQFMETIKARLYSFVRENVEQSIASLDRQALARTVQHGIAPSTT